MKNLFSSFVCLLIAIILSTLVYAQDEAAVDTLLRTRWNQYVDNPIILPGTQPGWNDGMAFGSTVIMFKDTLRMWYMGSPVEGFEGLIYIGYAWSLDGITWQQYPNNPVLSPQQGEWDYPHLADPNVIVDGDTLRMWFGGGNMIQSGMRIGYATSIDGINWTRYPQPVIEPNAAWNNDGVIPGSVIKEDGVFKMWFGGGVGTVGYPSPASHWNTGYATSSDGINWVLLDDPVISHGTSEDFDENLAINASVIKTNSGYDMWYGGHSETEQGVPNKSYANIGYARSSDGINWEKYYNNPVVSPGSVSPVWSKCYYVPSVYYDGEIFHMWFCSWGIQYICIGYATSDTSQATGIENDLLNQVPKEYELFQNYPNPFNPSTTISYSLPKQSQVTLKVYDILGNEIETLDNEEKAAGTHKINFNASNLSSGLYFYKLEAENYVEGKKMILLK